MLRRAITLTEVMIVIAIIAVIAAIAYPVISNARQRRPPPFDVVATRITEAACANDSQTLYKYAWPDEVKVNHLTPEKIHVWWAKVVLPRLHGFHRLPGQITGKGLFQGWCDYRLGDGEGHVTTWGASPELTDVGPRQTLQDFMQQAWIFDIQGRHGEISIVPMLKAMLKGVEEDKAVLKEIGLNYWVSRGRDNKLKIFTWDEAEVELGKKIASYPLPAIRATDSSRVPSSVVGQFGSIASHAIIRSGILPLSTSWKLVIHIG